MLIFFDCEFTGLRRDTTLVSIGLISETERTFYAELSDYDRTQVDAWLEEHVIQHLLFSAPGDTEEEYWNATRAPNNPLGRSIYTGYDLEMRGTLRDVEKELRTWLAQFLGGSITFVGDVLMYDWVLLRDLFQEELPENVVYIPLDLATLMYSRDVDPDISRRNFSGEGEMVKDLTRHRSDEDARRIRLCWNRLEQKALPDKLNTSYSAPSHGRPTNAIDIAW